MSIMNLFITAISVAATVGLSACGILFFGSWVMGDIQDLKNHSL